MESKWVIGSSDFYFWWRLLRPLMTLDVAYLSVKLKVLTDLPKTGAIAGFLVLLFL